MPVLPAVPSTTVPPVLRTPRFSASKTIHFAARSFTEPPGFMNSALPRISHPVSSLKRRRRISGVLPTASVNPSLIRIHSPFHQQRTPPARGADATLRYPRASRVRIHGGGRGRTESPHL